jgi:hypothetical protein
MACSVVSAHHQICSALEVQYFMFSLAGVRASKTSS